jgi:hypothetical protein
MLGEARHHAVCPRPAEVHLRGENAGKHLRVGSLP